MNDDLGKMAESQSPAIAAGKVEKDAQQFSRTLASCSLTLIRLNELHFREMEIRRKFIAELRGLLEKL